MAAMLSRFQRKTKPRHDPLVWRRKNVADKKSVLKKQPSVALDKEISRTDIVWRGVYGSLWAVFFLVVTYLSLFSSFLRVDAIRVVGAQAISENDVSNAVFAELSGRYFRVIPKNGYLLTDRRKLEDILSDRFKRIRSVTVSKTFPHTLTVEIWERELLAVWCSVDACFRVDEEGYAYDSSRVDDSEATSGKFLKIIDMSGQSVDTDELFLDRDFSRFMADVREGFRNDLGMEIVPECSTPSRFSYELACRTQEGWEIYLNARLPLTKSLRTLGLLLQKEISEERRTRLKYVDLRTENRVYYSVEGETVSAPEPISSGAMWKMNIESPARPTGLNRLSHS